MKYAFLLVFIGVALIGCSPARQLARELRKDPVYADRMMGFALFDPATGKQLIQHNADQPFAPASNTKLFTFYAGLLTLPDSLPVLLYAVRPDSLIFWGTGNPLLLHPDLPDTTALSFLRTRPERLFFSPANYDGPRFGPGWAWDDYNDDYSPELASLPIYGNVARFEEGQSSPRRFTDSLQITPDARPVKGVRRAEFSNQFTRSGPGKLTRQDVPFRWSAGLAAQLLADTLHRPVEVVKQAMPTAIRVLRGSSTDSLYKRMLQVSDNQFAEQVLFMISAERGLVSPGSARLHPVAELRRVADSVLRYPSVKAKWVDGSGLSRYNLFTPNVMIDLLTKIAALVPQPRLFALLPAAGQSGTLQEMNVAQKPYIFAKSGSMSGVYNLSGYILTQRGKVLYFSAMNNNFTGSVATVRRQTATLLKQVHDRF
ncbi:D-alanyl-D-alanine carboxypeptidase [Spirosoma utsteinense]|uniref:D-alanyl-D-alanine carboxypeptidase/D-alanyl-D-alanine-endopeptidase n=1 Tax=Spirosoma utsteinense TaxID=2585773 RepID=A0ABR6W0T8_9BACT|nr:D-alanyl-D-alanine carboxypeptidase [Spirosoma utsteinense]MBC3783702.1 D-alanyl-D-alanine carboxypeptidase/D-alanyl-D-alanine-endopeptidase [Spirosoma utsteinense]MBC3790155.1 D-alanyl-D-alanine carboxypeptidase/D-alanyl-D-alanine-endopeptidase [Spirosoma utsteinense]